MCAHVHLDAHPPRDGRTMVRGWLEMDRGPTFEVFRKFLLGLGASTVLELVGIEAMDASSWTSRSPPDTHPPPGFSTS